MQQSMDKIPKKENIILAGDFNGRIGNQPVPECIGTYGEQVTNHNGEALTDFCAFNKLNPALVWWGITNPSHIFCYALMVFCNTVFFPPVYLHLI